MIEFIFLVLAPLISPAPIPELPPNREGLAAYETNIMARKKRITYILTSAPMEDDDMKNDLSKYRRRHKSLFKKITIRTRRFKRTGFRNW